MDVLAGFKAAQREAWSHFAPLEAVTTRPAARLVRFSGLGANNKMLDVACGTGVVTAARLGAHVTALDLTPKLLERAHENGRIAGVQIEWHEGDAEALPFDAGAFDFVGSQFGHMFAPGGGDRRNVARAQARRHAGLLDLATRAAHHRENFERSSGPAQLVVQTLQKMDPARLASYRREYEALVAGYFDGNTVCQGYLLTRATKV